MYELRLGQPFQHNSMPKMRQPLRMPENYANSQDIFISKERPWRSYTQTDSIECQLQ